MDENELHFDSHRFAIESATFRYITDSCSGPGWDFNFSGPCVTDDRDEPEYPYGIRLMTEAGPLPLEPNDDLTGASIELNSPCDEDSGEPYFDVNVMESHDVLRLRLDVVERRGDDYLIKIIATVAETITGKQESLSLIAWAQREADHAYPT
ncbi:hypothetical protein Enr13x_71780 [Stieleria neptunia]|uniref:Uncharacterized protein n=1 Tax=Stieleria neptunia TaxID=2527979 RepID=A0A518I2C7_9BACT|nr:hypothetical protein [Stieleria neptunia]QDV47269.1 hypothetical protein Enr13x_71780 [Stieleria neptunia]